MKAKVIKEDFGDGQYFNRSAYNSAIRLTEDQINKFFKLSDMIGWEVDFAYRGKIRKATIVAVSLPESRAIAYPTGEINEHYQKEFAECYGSYPFEFRVAISGMQDFWSRKIDAIAFDNAKRVDYRPFVKFKNSSDLKKVYM